MRAGYKLHLAVERRSGTESLCNCPVQKQTIDTMCGRNILTDREPAGLRFSAAPSSLAGEGHNRDTSAGNGLKHKQTACQDSAKPNRQAVV